MQFLSLQSLSTHPEDAIINLIYSIIYLMCSKPTILPKPRNSFTTDGITFVQEFVFKHGAHRVPLIDVSTTGALNQIIGHAKFINEAYGNVYYRGVNGLYNTVLPSFVRGKRTVKSVGLNTLLNNICDDPLLSISLKLRNYKTPHGTENSRAKRFNKYCVEALLQHYAGYTRFIDIVDNHWVALWMGLHNFCFGGQGNKSCECQKRVINFGDYYEHMLATSSRSIDYNIYEYIILIAAPHGNGKNEYGIIESNELVEVDLRKALPSVFLRPHAQHALVIRKKGGMPSVKIPASFFDLATQVVGILRIRIDRSAKWLGAGDLVSANNLFPSPSIDHGYNDLLSRTDIFQGSYEILKYY